MKKSNNKVTKALKIDGSGSNEITTKNSKKNEMKEINNDPEQGSNAEESGSAETSTDNFKENEMEEKNNDPEQGLNADASDNKSLVNEILNQTYTDEVPNTETILNSSSETSVSPATKSSYYKHRRLLEKLYLQIRPVNMEYEADLDSKEKLTNRHTQFVVAKNVQKLAIANNWKLCVYNGTIYLFNGEYYEVIGKSEFKHFLGKCAAKFGVSESNAGYYSYQNGLLQQFMCETVLLQPEPPNGVLIKLKNGTYEFSKEGGKMLPHSPDDFITYQLAFDFDPNAKATMFEKFINKVLPDKSCQLVLAEFIACVFVKSSHLKLEKALLMYGEGANGKSVFYDLINALLGERNVTNYSLSNLMDPNGYYTFKLATSLLNYSSELGGKVDAALFKTIISGESVSARQIYGQPTTIKDYAKIAFNTNTLPQSVENTNAYFRRFIIIPFEVIIPEAEQDKQLAQKIISAGELSGIFNWVLEGLSRLLANGGFSECKAAERALETYKDEANTVKMFIDEDNYEKSYDRYISAKHMSDEYATFCKDYRYVPLNHKNFIRRLKSLGFRVENISKRAVVYAEKKSSPRIEERPYNPTLQAI